MKFSMLMLTATLLVITSVFSTVFADTDIPYNHEHVYTEGRIGVNSSQTAAEIYWPGSSVSLSFSGQGLIAILDDQKGENYFTVVVDGEQSAVLKLEAGKHEYVLAENLENGKHTVGIHKRNDWSYGQTAFYGFKLDGTETAPIEEKDLFIEFYGNSITTGYGNEDYTQDRPSGEFTNNYNAYGAVTARNLNAEYSCISHSGIGIMVSWHALIMPEEYYRHKPSDASSHWDFSKKQPDVVVVNLFQNDSWIVNNPGNDQFKRRFGTQKPSETETIDAYVSFLNSILGHYPDAEIICMLGNMDITKSGSKWPDYVSKAAEIFNDKVHTLFVPFANSGGHPHVEDHLVSANMLTELIQTFGKKPAKVVLNIKDAISGEMLSNVEVSIKNQKKKTDASGIVVFENVAL